MADRAFIRYSGEDQDQSMDLTELIKWEEAEFGTRAWRGESTNSNVTIRDETGRSGAQENIPAGILPYSLASRNVARLTLGSNVLWQGRIIRKDYNRGAQLADRAREVDIDMEDVNTDLRGVVVHNWEREAEDDTVRVPALVAAYLSGDPSPTRNMSTAGISGSNTIDLGVQKYVRTDVPGVLSDIALETNKNYFVLPPKTTSEATTGTLYYDGNDAVFELCPFRITDREDEVRASPTNRFFPIWNVGPAETENGQEILSGIWYFYGDAEDQYVHVTDATVAAIYGHYEIVQSDSTAETEAQALARANSLLAYRKLEERTNNVTIGPLTDEQVGSIRAGQTISIKARAITSADDLYKTRFISQMKLTTPSPGLWFAHLQLERPVRFRAYGFGNRPTAKPPSPPVEPTDGTELFSRTWDYEDAATLNSTDGDWPWGGHSSAVDGDAPVGHGAFATVYAWASGVQTPSVGFSSGAHLPCAEGQTVEFTGQVSRNWGGTGFAVKTYVLTWWIGNSQAGSLVLSPPPCSRIVAADFEFTETVPAGVDGFSMTMPRLSCQDNLTIRVIDDDATPGSAGDESEPVAGAGQGSTGTPGTYAPQDHVHEHGFLAGDEIHYHSADQVAYEHPDITDVSDVGGALDNHEDRIATVEGAVGADASVSTLNFVIDGGGEEITTGIVGDVLIDFDCEIEAVTMLADQAGAIVVDIWNDTYANFPPTDADSITASAPPTIGSGDKSTDATLTGWGVSIAAGDILRFSVDSVTDIQRVTVALKLRRT